ncbi:hypothetical protein OCU04_008363 [Sclerotinia nivalis]|uniref:Uncharacterized protein n=1 Tax=Sclerotinia nivalis TaxID=352851 RepID=A0A9X0DI03_9HELO|nr:hypothetical protein OCU04_008363 [Sclerotinia nivalis]
MQSSDTIKKEPLGDLIQDDRDFKATYAYTLAARGADEKDHPAAWEERKLIPAGIYVQVIERILSAFDFSAVLIDLLLDKPGRQTHPETETYLSGQSSSGSLENPVFHQTFLQYILIIHVLGETRLHTYSETSCA